LVGAATEGALAFIPGLRDTAPIPLLRAHSA